MPLQGVRSLYGASKLSAEVILQEYAAQYDIPAVIDRCGVLTGPWQLGRSEQGLFAFWLATHYFKVPLNYMSFGGMGKQVRDLLHITDLAALILKQARCLIEDGVKFRGDVFNVGGSTHSNLSLQETSAICARLTGNHMKVGSILQERPADLKWYVTDNGRTGDVFEWKPERPPVSILEDMYQWMRDNEDDCRKIFDLRG
jgi:CDP-paratose 2-epimerase